MGPGGRGSGRRGGPRTTRPSTGTRRASGTRAPTPSVHDLDGGRREFPKGAGSRHLWSRDIDQGLAVDPHIRPGAAVERVRPGAAVERVVAGDTAQRVVQGVADERIVQRSADGV